MKRTGLVWLLLTGIMVTGAFLGCKTTKVDVKVSGRDLSTSHIDVENVAKFNLVLEELDNVTVEPGPGAPPPPNVSETSLVPITQDIISLVINSGKALKDFQYYLSGAIALEHDGLPESSIEINKGEGLAKVIYVPVIISIDGGTKGVLKTLWVDDVNDPRVAHKFAVCFGENNDERLHFEENATGTRFDLVYDKSSQSIVYGGKPYRLRIMSANNPPYLLIRYKEETSVQPVIRQVPGRSVSQH
jgi:hypothetical protein